MIIFQVLFTSDVARTCVASRSTITFQTDASSYTVKLEPSVDLIIVTYETFTTNLVQVNGLYQNSGFTYDIRTNPLEMVLNVIASDLQTTR